MRGGIFFDQENYSGGTGENDRPSVAKPCFDSLDTAWLVRYGFDSALEKFRYRTLVLFCAYAVIRVYDASGNVIEMHEHAGEFKEP